ncbi:maleylpyruvate isomerase family mycothiol-dependent enzyme [Oryzobacter telluris]|uniref:maleylpyruvate isomerase family mycothiol-dependent enzyme n=1 Tax=Oryzobacter telluris TaxID=3149179 RepID=UPI00370DC579
MPVHPPAPTDPAGLVDAWARTVRNVIDLGRTTRPGDADLPTDCPGWTVLDQVAHVAGAEALSAGDPTPDLDVSGHPHVRHDFGALMEKFVEARRGRSLEEVLDELEERLEERLAVFAADDDWTTRTVAGPFGPTTFPALLRIRSFDVWVHEQDLREALGRPGGLDTAAASLAMTFLFDALPRMVARDAEVPPGNAVVVELTGPTVGRAGVRVEERDGKALGIPLFTGDADEHPDVVTTSLTMSTQVAGRLLGGRRAPEDLHVVVQGDEEVARRVLTSMALTP